MLAKEPAETDNFTMSKDQSNPYDRVPKVHCPVNRDHFHRSAPRGSRDAVHDGPFVPPEQRRGLGQLLGWARVLAQSSLMPLILVAFLPACISETPPGTVFGSDPPGAILYVDGKESGYVTPCSLHLSEGDDHTVRLELPGYLPAEFEIEKALRVDLIGWGEGTTLSSGFTSPTYLPFFGLIAPIRTNRGLSPGRIFVRLQAMDASQ